MSNRLIDWMKHGLRWGTPLPRQPVSGYLEWALLRDILRAWAINCVFDVGANTGQFVHNLRRIGYQGHICSFEPAEEAYAALVASFRNDSKWTGYNYALGSENTQHSFHVAVDASAMSSFLQPKVTGWKLREAVVQTTCPDRHRTWPVGCRLAATCPDVSSSSGRIARDVGRRARPAQQSLQTRRRFLLASTLCYNTIPPATCDRRTLSLAAWSLDDSSFPAQDHPGGWGRRHPCHDGDVSAHGTHQRCAAQRRRRLAARQTQAMAMAQRAADVLRADFGATQVVLIGSLTGATPFHDRSDVDLVVWGLRPEDYWRAVAQMLCLDPAIEVDLIEAEGAPSWVQEAVAREGVTL